MTFVIHERGPHLKNGKRGFETGVCPSDNKRVFDEQEQMVDSVTEMKMSIHRLHQRRHGCLHCWGRIDLIDKEIDCYHCGS